MALEPFVTFIADLDPTAPDGSERKNQGDDHFRNTKRAVKNAFAGFLGAVCVTGTDGGAVNAYTLTPATPLPSYSSRMIVLFVPTVTNTGAATLNISALGAAAIKRRDGSDVVANDLQAGRPYLAIRIGSVFQLSSVTQNYIDQLVFSATIPGISDPANLGKALVGGGTYVSLDGRGAPIIDKGSSGTTAQVINYADGEGQTLTATGNFTLSATGFPVGRFAAVLVRGVDLGAFALTTTGITWIKSDGAKTQTFSQTGITFPVNGEGFFALYTYGDGIVYGAAR
jgi:hypothetical protein